MGCNFFHGSLVLSKRPLSYPIWLEASFCQSSARAVCHNLMAIFLPGNFNPHIHQSSGLFVRHCMNCGTKLTLGPLQLIVVLAYHLATSGDRRDTLFGAIAVLTCLLRLGANVFQKSEMSILEILRDSWEYAYFGGQSEGVCKHKLMDADEFMQTIPSVVLNFWMPERLIARDCMRGILQLAKAGKIHHTDRFPIPNLFEIRDSIDIGDERNLYGKRSFNNEDDEEGCPLKREHEYWEFPCGNPQLGLVWTVVQAEMLTHRRTF